MKYKFYITCGDYNVRKGETIYYMEKLIDKDKKTLYFQINCKNKYVYGSDLLNNIAKIIMLKSLMYEI